MCMNVRAVAVTYCKVLSFPFGLGTLISVNYFTELCSISLTLFYCMMNENEIYECNIKIDT
jgi:hypothetical protein